MNREENDPRYSSPYRQGHIPAAHRSTSVVGSSRNDYDAKSMLSNRALPSKEPTWNRRPGHDGYDRPNSQRLHDPQAAHQHNQFNRHGSPMRQYSYKPHESEYEKPEANVRREYSPPRKERSQDGTFKGFTTPFPGSESGVNPEEDVRRRRYPVEPAQRSPPTSRYPPQLSNAPNETDHHRTNESRYRPYSNYAHTSAPEPHRHAPENANERRGPPEPSYAASEAGTSIASRRHQSNYGSYRYDRTWEEASNYGNVPGDRNVVQPKPDQTTLSPRTFQRECQRAYHEARTQRLRNLEEGLYGKCTWATYDSKYC